MPLKFILLYNNKKKLPYLLTHTIKIISIIGEFIVSDKLAKIFNYSFESYENMHVYSRTIDEDIENI